MTKKALFAFILMVISPLSMAAGHTQSISIGDPTMEPANSPDGLLRPTKGMTMDSVTAKFGAPDEEIDAVGEPPITRWKYDGYTVYFEHNRVIHSAVHK